MKITTKILIGILMLTTLIPIMISKICLFDHDKAVEFFGLSSLTADLDKILFVLGGFILASCALPVLSIVRLMQRKNDGFTLAYLVGLIGILRGLLTIVNFSSESISGGRLTITPIVVGAVIVLFTFIAKKQGTFGEK